MSTEGGAASAGSETSTPNEDAYLVHDGLGLYVVADGSSGGPSGEVASRIAIRALEDFIREAEKPSLMSLFRSFPSKALALKATHYAMQQLADASKNNNDIKGMSTTATMLLIHGDKAVVSHVGDSRLYLARNGEIARLTVDSDLTIAGGGTLDRDDNPPIQCFMLKTCDADNFLLCTAGAAAAVEDTSILSPLTDGHPREVAARVVSAARRLDSSQDATVVVVRILEDSADGWLMVSGPVSRWTYGHTVEYAS